jgi:hypothetical protein
MLLILLAPLLFWLGNRAPNEVILVVSDGAGRPEIILAWSVALRLWPVILTGAIPALLIAGALALLSLLVADNADQRQQVVRLQQIADAATARAEQAEDAAQARYAEQLARADSLQLNRTGFPGD